MECPISTYSGAGNKKSCIVQECQAGQYLSKIAATSSSDGCADYGAGKWSGAGQKTICTGQECPVGRQSTLLAATSSLDGCTDCGIGKWSGN